MAPPHPADTYVPQAATSKLVLLQNTSSKSKSAKSNVNQKNAAKHDKFKARKAKEKAERDAAAKQPKVLVLGANVGKLVQKKDQSEASTSTPSISTSSISPSQHPPLSSSSSTSSSSSSTKLDPTHVFSAVEIAIAGLPPNANKANLLNPNYPGYDPKIAAEIRKLRKEAGESDKKEALKDKKNKEREEVRPLITMKLILTDCSLFLPIPPYSSLFLPIPPYSSIFLLRILYCCVLTC